MNLLELKRSNRLLNIEEFHLQKTELQSFPRALFIEITRHCNLSCPMCRPTIKTSPTDILSLKDFKFIGEKIFPYAEIIDLRGWGESTIIADFMEYVNFTLQFKAKVKLITNLTADKPKMWKELIDNNVILGVSFDAVNNTVLQKIRPGIKVDRIKKNLQNIAKLQVDDNNQSQIYFQTTIQKANYRELVQIIETAHQYNIPLVKIHPMVGESYNQNLPSKIPDQVLKYMKKAIERAIELDIKVEVLASFLPDNRALGNCVCTHPWSYAYIDYQGNLGCCDHLMGAYCRENLFGNILNTTFMEIWNSKKLQTLRMQHKCIQNNHINRRSVEEPFAFCNWCYEYRFVDFEHEIFPHLQNYVMSGIDYMGVRNYEKSSNY